MALMGVAPCVPPATKSPMRVGGPWWPPVVCPSGHERRLRSDSMRCPTCSADDTRVIDSRPADGGGSVRRRRRCETCSHRFTTYERYVPAAQVRKRDGALQSFDPEKVQAGLESALADRAVPADTVERLVARTEALFDSASLVSTEEIGRVVLEGLREVDEVAYLRFASVYKDFQGTSDFEREMAAMESSAEPAT